FQPVAALTALAPRFEECAVVVVIRRVLQFVRRAAFDSYLDTALALVGVPDSVVEAELHLLLDVTGKVVRRHPARVDVKCCLTAVGIRIDNLELHRVPRRSRGRADQAALSGRLDAGEPPPLTPNPSPPRGEGLGVRGSEREVDQLDVVN